MLPAGSKGVGQIFAKVPQIMLCKPSTNDRWDRRVVQLAAFMHRHGHCNVPEVSWHLLQVYKLLVSTELVLGVTLSIRIYLLHSLSCKRNAHTKEKITPSVTCLSNDRGLHS